MVGTCIVALAMTELRFAQMQPLAVQFEVKEWHVFFFLFFFLSRFLFDGVCYNGTRISGQDSKVCHRHWKEMIKHAVSVEVILNSWLLWAVKL